MKTLTVSILLFVSLATACSTMYKFPECNDKYAQESMLAKMAAKYEVCLQDVGRNIATVSLLAIGIEPALAKETRLAAEVVVSHLNDSITDIAFKELIGNSFRAAILVDLVELNSDYLAEMDTGNPIDEESRVIIQTYLVEDFIPRLKRYELLAATSK